MEDSQSLNEKPIGKERFLKTGGIAVYQSPFFSLKNLINRKSNRDAFQSRA